MKKLSKKEKQYVKKTIINESIASLFSTFAISLIIYAILTDFSKEIADVLNQIVNNEISVLQLISILAIPLYISIFIIRFGENIIMQKKQKKSIK